MTLLAFAALDLGNWFFGQASMTMNELDPTLKNTS